MISIERRIKAFSKLGEMLRNIHTGKNDAEYEDLIRLADTCSQFNPWFTSENVYHSLVSIGESLTEEKLVLWANRYYNKLDSGKPEKRVGVVMAGNIPLVGFHDFLCVLFSGNIVVARLSSDDNKLLPAITARLTELEPGFKPYIFFTEHKLENFDAVIATGSNNTSRYFEYYFRHVPHIIRKNRNGVAVLTGNEKEEDFRLLGNDIFLYFGMGCRSIAKIFVPPNYKFNKMFNCLEDFKDIANHHKFYNNYEYHKSIFLINGVKHFDNGFLLLIEDQGFSSPPSVLYYEEYDSITSLNDRLRNDHEQIQCIVSNSVDINDSIPLGKAQKPELWDYADGVDTMDFLLNL